MDRVFFSRKSDEWCTPVSLFNKLSLEFGFTLDPCSTDLNHLCSKYYTISDDGLSKDWSGEVVFCNPPYSDIYRWVKKAFESHCLSVLLVPARTDTSWFHEFVLGHAEIRFIRGRLRFSGSKSPAPFPSMILIFKNV